MNGALKIATGVFCLAAACDAGTPSFAGLLCKFNPTLACVTEELRAAAAQKPVLESEVQRQFPLFSARK